MPESVNYWTPISGPAGQLFHADPHLLPVGEFPPINQPAELGWGRA
jgi:hypothetical protein